MNKLVIKIWVWHGLVAVFAWRLLSLSIDFQFNNVTGLDVNLPSFGWFLLTVGTMALGYILLSSKGGPAHTFVQRLLPVSISAIVALLFLFYLGFTPLNISAVVIFWLCNVWAQERAIRDMSERLKINIQRTLATTLMPIVLGFFIMASFAAYQSNFAEEIKKGDQLPNKSLVFIEEAVDKMFGSQLGPENSRQRQQAVKEVSVGTFEIINDFLRPHFKWAPPAVAFGLLIILWGLSWIFIWAATLLASVIFWILKKTRVVRIEEKDVKAEVLVI